MQPVALETARAMVDEIIATGRLILEPVQHAGASLDSLGPITKEFFSKYPGVRTKHGGFRVGVSEVHASEYVAGYVSIGHSEDWDIVQRPGADEVFVVEGAEASESEMDVRFPTIYHLILDEVQRTI